MQTISSPSQRHPDLHTTLIPDDVRDLLHEGNEPSEPIDDMPHQAPSSGLPARRRTTPSLIALIETVQTLENAYRPITPQERERISSWPGWGASAPAFETPASEK